MTGDHGGHDAGDVGYNHHHARDQHFLVFFVLTKDFSIDFQHVSEMMTRRKGGRKKLELFSLEARFRNQILTKISKCWWVILGWTDLDDVLSKCLLFLTPFSFSRCSSWNPPLT